MGRRRGHRGRVDKNQRGIADALMQAGVSVCLLSGVGDGVPDLLCSTHEKTWLIEVKGHKGTMTDEQTKFKLRWRGEIQLVRTIDDALATIGRRR